MKLRTITRDLLLIIGISAGGLLTPSSVFAKTRYLSDVPQNSFLMTNRTIHTTNDYFKDVKITIPKGTIFQIGGFSKGTKTGHPYLNINLNDLRWSIRKPVILSKHNQQSTAGIWATTANFSRVQTPDYLSYFKKSEQFPDVSYDVLWQGFKYPAGHKVVTDRQTAIRVTSDGYLEVINNLGILDSKLAQPSDMAKVQKTITKGNVTYLYTASKVTGIPSPRINTKGRYQYRVKITNTNRHLITVNGMQIDPRYVDSVDVVVRYRIGNSNVNYFISDGTSFN